MGLRYRPSLYATNNVLSVDINLTNGGEYKIRANNGWDIGFLDSLVQIQTEMVFLTAKIITLLMKELLTYRVTLDVFTARKYIKSHRFVII